MNRIIFRYIEKELYDYEDTKKLIEDIQSDIANDSGLNYEGEKTGKTNKTSNPTENKAIKLMCNKQLNKAINTVAAIEKARLKLNEEDLRLFDLKYVQCIHWKRIISSHMPMSESTYHRRRNRIVSLVGQELGFDTE